MIEVQHKLNFMNTISLPGWTTKIDEISNGIIRITLTDKFGRKVEIIDSASIETIAKANNCCFTLEKEVSNNWIKFLFDFCLLQLEGTIITKKSNQEKDVNSWIIEVGDSRLLFLTKESWLISQKQSENIWFDNHIIKEEEITYETVSLFLKHMK